MKKIKSFSEFSSKNEGIMDFIKDPTGKKRKLAAEIERKGIEDESRRKELKGYEDERVEGMKPENRIPYLRCQIKLYDANRQNYGHIWAEKRMEEAQEEIDKILGGLSDDMRKSIKDDWAYRHTREKMKKYRDC